MQQILGPNQLISGNQCFISIFHWTRRYRSTCVAVFYEVFSLVSSLRHGVHPPTGSSGALRRSPAAAAMG